MLKDYIKSEKSKISVKNQYDAIKLLRDPLHKASCIGTIEKSFEVPGIWPIRYRSECVLNPDISSYLSTISNKNKDEDPPERITSPLNTLIEPISDNLITEPISPSNIFITGPISPSKNLITNTQINITINSPTKNLSIYPSSSGEMNITTTSPLKMTEFDDSGVIDFIPNMKYNSVGNYITQFMNESRTNNKLLLQIVSELGKFSERLDAIELNQELSKTKKHKISISGGATLTAEEIEPEIKKRKLNRLEKKSSKC